VFPWEFNMQRLSSVVRLTALTLALIVVVAGDAMSQTVSTSTYDYRLLATNKTSTMEKELNEAADAGFHFQAVMGGDSAFGGKEVVVIMSRETAKAGRFGYKLLATSKTSTMQKELQEAADAGFYYKGQTVFGSTFGGDEVVVILERDKDLPAADTEYKLLATSKTSTLQKELLDAGAAGYELVGMTISKTAIGGKEVVAITKRTRAK
jgi:hypothetical protein